jgi:hypothetical protein
MTTELETFILSKTNVSAKTITNYKNAYKRIKQFLSTDITASDEEKLIDIINFIDNVGSKIVLLNLMIMMKNQLQQSTKKLDKFRDKLFIERDATTKLFLEKKNDELPSYKIVDEYIKTLDSTKYIVNYLTFYFGLRNDDVNLFITTRKLTKNILNSTNYLIVKKTEIELIINTYKTSKNYLQKRIVIRNKNFIQICQDIPLLTYLLTGNENPVNESSLHNTITRMFYKHNDKYLTETDYIKILIKHLTTKPNLLTELKKISEYRGSSLDNMIKYYNIDFKK